MRKIHTPWGVADNIERKGKGIFFADTPGHGGYFVPNDMLYRIPKAHQDRARYWSGSPNWYEEDCEWASVVVAFPELFTGAQRQAAQESISLRQHRL